jgi:nitrate reductase beta subunit
MRLHARVSVDRCALNIAALDQVGLTSRSRPTQNKMLPAIANYEDRFVIPARIAKQAINTFGGKVEL